MQTYDVSAGMDKASSVLVQSVDGGSAGSQERLLETGGVQSVNWGALAAIAIQVAGPGGLRCSIRRALPRITKPDRRITTIPPLVLPLRVS
jgi:hypothetical protein